MSESLGDMGKLWPNTSKNNHVMERRCLLIGYTMSFD